MRKYVLMQTALQLRLALRHVEPAIWRRVQVTDDTTLPRLHRVIQVVMGWEDYHLHQFTIAGERYTEPDPEDEEFGRTVLDERKLRLRDFALAAGTVFEYLYDFGDNWTISIRVDGILIVEPETFFPILVAGERSGPPEDSGGPFGYMDYLQALVDPQHERHEELVGWRGPFDPEAFSLDQINAELRREFRPRAVRRPAKSKTVQ